MRRPISPRETIAAFVQRRPTLVSIFVLSPRLFKVPPLHFYDSHLLNMSLMVVVSILLSCTVCIGGPIYLGITFGHWVGISAIGGILLVYGGLVLWTRWQKKS